MARPAGSTTVTEGVRVSAEAQYQPHASNPDARQFVYAYRVTIHNEGPERARLLARHWIILDADNGRRDVRGPGVVGEFPDLGPDEEYSYVSSCPLPTSWGTMEGTYTMEREDGSTFEVSIGRFFLVPQSARAVVPRR